MNLFLRTLAGGLLASLLSPAAARAQLVPDGGTTTINNTTNDLTVAPGGPNLTVGTNGGNTTLILTNQGRVINNVGTLGQEGTSTNNLVLVTGSGSLWTNKTVLFVGGFGARNQLTISNGAQVGTSGESVVGSSGSSTNNRVLVTGAGSRWVSGGNLTLRSTGNQLTILDGGQVLSPNATLPVSDNTALVSGSNSQWLVSSNLAVGMSGGSNRSNRLSVINGGKLVSGRDLMIGSNGFGHQLIVSNGGMVTCQTGYIGRDSGGDSNLAWVGGGSQWLASGDLVVGQSGLGNQLIVSASDVAGNIGSVGSGADANNNQVLVTDAGTLRLGTLYVGLLGLGNRLTVSNAGQVIATNFISIGHNAGSDGQIVTVAGPLSTLTSSGRLTVGSFGSGSLLTIRDGGRVTNFLGYIGTHAAASNNAVVVSGPGSIWNNGIAGLVVGESAKGNSLTISNGGQVFNSQGLIGINNGADNNTVLVTGAGSLWNNGSQTLTVGLNGFGSRLTITNGGRVICAGASIGEGSLSTVDNAVAVTGADSLWTINGDLTVGGHAERSSLMISNGGQVANLSAMIGVHPFSTENSVSVTGAGSLWANQFNLTVGVGGFGNRLTIGVGATVSVGLNLIVGAAQAPILGTNRVTVGGNLWVTNAAGTGVLEARHGAVDLVGGTIMADKLLLTNGTQSLWNFTAGTLQTAGTMISNGPAFVVGDGVNAAVFELRGGVHSFANGLIISPNATLRGCGTIAGDVINQGAIIADCPGQALTFTGAFTNFGTIFATNGGVIHLFGITQINKTATTAAISFATVTGLSFTLEYKNAVDDPTWTPILPALAGNGTVMTQTDTNATVPARIYRVRAQ